MTILSLPTIRALVEDLRLPANADTMIVSRDPASVASATIIARDLDINILLYGIEDGLAVCSDLSAGQQIVVLAPKAHHRALTLLIERATATVVATMSVE